MPGLVASRLLVLGVSLLAPVLLAVAAAGSVADPSALGGVLVGAGLGVVGGIVLGLALLALAAERSLVARGGAWTFGAHLSALLLALPGLLVLLATGVGGGTWAERALLAVPTFTALYYGWLLAGLVVGLLVATGRRAVARVSQAVADSTGRAARDTVARGTRAVTPGVGEAVEPEWAHRGRDGVVLGYVLLVLGITTATQSVLGSVVAVTVSVGSVLVLVVLTRMLLASTDTP